VDGSVKFDFWTSWILEKKDNFLLLLLMMFLMEINKEKLNPRRGWMDKKMGKTFPIPS